MRIVLYHHKYGGQLFDVSSELVDDLRQELYLWGWRENPKAAKEAVMNPEVDLRQSDDELSTLSKSALLKAAEDQLGIELDRRKSVKGVIREIRRAQYGDG